MMMRKPRVLMIYTGGTIGMIENPKTKSLEAFDFDYIEQQVPEIRLLTFEINTYTDIPPRDSSDVGPDLWIEIAKVIEAEYDAYDGFVVLHGTDTMAYTAAALSFMLEGLRKPVLLTGSQLPVGKLRTDGRENLLTALEIAASQDEQGIPYVQEVCVFFNNQLLRGNRCSKTSADQFLAFQSLNYPNLATVGIEIHYDKQAMLPTYPAGQELVVRTQLDPNILVMKLFPGLPIRVLESAFKTPELKGIVLETFGSGNAPSGDDFIRIVKRAVDDGIVVVNITQCMRGMVQMSRYETGRTLLNAGVVSGYDMTVEAAVAKLMYLLGNCGGTEEVKEAMSRSLRGEMTI